MEAKRDHRVCAEYAVQEEYPDNRAETVCRACQDLRGRLDPLDRTAKPDLLAGREKTASNQLTERGHEVHQVRRALKVHEDSPAGQYV